MILQVDMQSARPIYEQLRDQIVLGIASGALTDGEALPSVRRLAADLGINLHTVNKAYAVLCDDGYIVMDRRRGATVLGSAEESGAFHAALAERLVLSAAEARCHAYTRERFLSLCGEAYNAASGKEMEGKSDE